MPRKKVSAEITASPSGDVLSNNCINAEVKARLMNAAFNLNLSNHVEDMKRSIWGLSLAAVILISPNYSYAYDSLEDLKRFKIEAQTLSQALTNYAEQSGLQILFKPEEIPNIDVPGFSGFYTFEQALRKLLRPTQLAYSFGGKSVVVIYVKEQRDSKAEQSPAFIPIVKDDINLDFNAGETEEIIITGIRNSLLEALKIKRSLQPVVEVVSSHDIGKFPDKNVADSLQRIPGVSVDRIWGEGRDINIRGTDKDVNRTLMNGQNVASAYWWANDNLGRGFNYSILASELVASLEVYKSPSADRDEGSIGGMVNIRTRQPFDLNPLTLRITLEEQYSELPDIWDPQAAVLASWTNESETFGILGTANFQNRQLRRDGLEAFPDNNMYTLRNTDGDIIENDVHVPFGMGSAIFQQDRERQTGNLTLQWEPNHRVEVIFNSVFSDMDMDNNNQNYLALPGQFILNQHQNNTVSDYEISESSNGIKSLIRGQLGDSETPSAALDAIFRESYIRSYVYDLDLRYQGQGWRFHSQLGKTLAEGGSNHDYLYRFYGSSTLQYDLNHSRIDFEFLDIDPLDPSSLNYLSPETHDWIRKMEDKESYAQFDYEFDLTSGNFRSIKMGYKWREHIVENNRIRGEIDTSDPLWQQVQNFSLADASSGLSPALHNQTATSGSLTRYAWADIDLINQNIFPDLQKILKYEYDKSAYYQIREGINALYIKSTFAGENFRGDAGFRLVETAQKSLAYEFDTLQEYNRNYVDFLPSFNLVYSLEEDLLLRGSAAKVMARPSFPDLATNIIEDATASGMFSGGNPDLDPFRARQIDFGLEWYFKPGAIVAGTVFYKDISTFIYVKSEQELIGGEFRLIERPRNSRGLIIRGFEAQIQQHFDNNIGFIANYTYTDADVVSNPNVDQLNLPGNSKDQFNASIYYEDFKYSGRISYNFRSKSFGGFTGGSQDLTRAYDQWDANFTWNVTDDISVYVEAVNLLNEVVYRRTANGIPQGFYENGRRFVIGTRISVW